MIARPVSSALACGRCRHAILGAVASWPTGLHHSGLQLPQRALRQARGLSTTRALQIDTPQDFPPPPPPPPSLPPRVELSHPDRRHDLEDAEAEEEDNGSEDSPWFLLEDPPLHPPIIRQANLPTIPDDAPAFFKPMMQYIYEDMGLDDLALLDLRDLDPPPALGPNLIMLLGTARSERHLHVCSGRFVRWLKRNHKIDARADGLIGPGELKTKLRRLRKRARLLGTNAAILPGGDNGISTGWVCVNFSTSEGGDGETEMEAFDEGGRFSGFGAPRTGTTVVVQVMTEARRGELDLEVLWQGLFRRNMLAMKKMQAEVAAEQVGKDGKGGKDEDGRSRDAEVDDLVSSKVQLPQSSSALQWQALKRASQQQQRYFSTSSRVQSAQSAQSAQASPTSPAVSPSSAEDPAPDSMPDLATLGRQVADVQILGNPVSPSVLQGLIAAALHAPPHDEANALSRLALVDKISAMAHERGMPVLSTDWLVALIESIVLSPAYGPELQRVQQNIEFILTEQRSRLTPEHVLRLMTVHAGREDWPRFWDVFRLPARFGEPRGVEVYELAFRAMAATGDRRLCIDALRWVWPEMTRETAPVWPVGKLYEALKACIMVADPAAEKMLRNPPNPETLGTLEALRFKNREFLRVLREVEGMRREHLTAVARKQREQTLSRLGGKSI